MNVVITDGLVLMPAPFADGLTVWSSGDGTPGSDTYAVSGTGAYVPADQDFAGCLEITKTQSVTKLRYMGQTPVMPGVCLRIRARVKAVAGPFPAVRIAGWAGSAGGAHLAGVTETGPSVQLTSYGEVVEVSAIVGSGRRGGVDMVWPGATFGHFGLDLTGPNGAVVRIDDIVIEDITDAFLRDMLAEVDVRDYGAVGDGVTDDAAAFAAADAAAAGAVVLVPRGGYFLGSNVTFDNRVRFEGTLTMPADKVLVLQKNFDFVSYLDAFGNEELAFRKAFQALITYADYESLDLCGRRIALSGPVDMQAAVAIKTTFATRKVIRNGQFQPLDGTAWNTTVATSQATYSTSSPLKLTGVVNAANIARGSLVTGNGVGREIYVTDVDVATSTITLSNPLFDAAGTQVFTFTRFKYLLDFSGFDSLSQFNFTDVEFYGDGLASGLMLARDGMIFALQNCFITKPKDRGITSIGNGCQGMLLDRCQFISNEQGLKVQDRTSIGFNANANDIKIRDCRVVRFKHFCVLGGTGNLIAGNHWFADDSEPDGVRKGGIVITTPNCKTVITGNYIDNNFVEWTNEYESAPDFANQYSFGGLTLTGNIFTTNDVAPWFNWIVVKPYGAGHYIQGLAVQGNVFRSINGNITRVEAVDTTFSDLDYGRMRNITFTGNTFNSVVEPVQNPVLLSHVQSTADRYWVVDSGTFLPFKGKLRTVEAVVPDSKVADAGNVATYEQPWVQTEYGTAGRQARLVWKTACTGSVRVQARMDEPT
ncbi:MAG: right-handed parallel beta-helix repeat-containing protein [Limimaricola sp.]|uniref:glycosyl hydrolase family 28-related protein n=1 Tax=Limimaricola sp. TaxID=2211665 RepID=UPI001DC8353D|nr:glycosyl hydrolase family 28-related protein [Limimaricola sp.]MBI1415814.1 right-handed parallel beta-helix repeat-containing protein [Limimaricola sp.]